VATLLLLSALVGQAAGFSRVCRCWLCISYTSACRAAHGVHGLSEVTTSRSATVLACLSSERGRRLCACTCVVHPSMAAVTIASECAAECAIGAVCLQLADTGRRYVLAEGRACATLTPVFAKKILEILAAKRLTHEWLLRRHLPLASAGASARHTWSH
jgi:hypothetical protein